MKDKMINITEKEYKDFIRLQVSNEELERITQKRIDDALADSNKKHSEEIEKLKNDFKAEKDKIFDDILNKNAIMVKCRNNSFGSYRETIHFVDNEGDAKRLLGELGFENIEYEHGYPSDKVTFKDRPYYSICAINRIMTDIAILEDKKANIISQIQNFIDSHAPITQDVIDAIKDDINSCTSNNKPIDKKKTIKDFLRNFIK